MGNQGNATRNSTNILFLCDSGKNGNEISWTPVNVNGASSILQNFKYHNITNINTTKSQKFNSVTAKKTSSVKEFDKRKAELLNELSEFLIFKNPEERFNGRNESDEEETLPAPASNEMLLQFSVKNPGEACPNINYTKVTGKLFQKEAQMYNNIKKIKLCDVKNFNLGKVGKVRQNPRKQDFKAQGISVKNVISSSVNGQLVFPKIDSINTSETNSKKIIVKNIITSNAQKNIISGNKSKEILKSEQVMKALQYKSCLLPKVQAINQSNGSMPTKVPKIVAVHIPEFPKIQVGKNIASTYNKEDKNCVLQDHDYASISIGNNTAKVTLQTSSKMVKLPVQTQNEIRTKIEIQKPRVLLPDTKAVELKNMKQFTVLPQKKCILPKQIDNVTTQRLSEDNSFRSVDSVISNQSMLLCGSKNEGYSHLDLTKDQKKVSISTQVARSNLQKVLENCTLKSNAIKVAGSSELKTKNILTSLMAQKIKTNLHLANQMKVLPKTGYIKNSDKNGVLNGKSNLPFKSRILCTKAGPLLLLPNGKIALANKLLKVNSSHDGVQNLNSNKQPVHIQKQAPILYKQLKTNKNEFIPLLPSISKTSMVSKHCEKVVEEITSSIETVNSNSASFSSHAQNLLNDLEKNTQHSSPESMLTSINRASTLRCQNTCVDTTVNEKQIDGLTESDINNYINKLPINLDDLQTLLQIDGNNVIGDCQKPNESEDAFATTKNNCIENKIEESNVADNFNQRPEENCQLDSQVYFNENISNISNSITDCPELYQPLRRSDRIKTPYYFCDYKTDSIPARQSRRNDDADIDCCARTRIFPFEVMFNKYRKCKKKSINKKRLSGLQENVQRYRSDKPHNCLYCSEKFQYFSLFRHHLAMTHGIRHYILDHQPKAENIFRCA